MLVTIVYYRFEYSSEYCIATLYIYIIIFYNEIRQRKKILMSDDKKRKFIQILYCLYI